MSHPERDIDFDILRGASSPPAHPCPQPPVWLEIAAGIAAPELERASVAHAAQCRSCGAQLQQALSLCADPEDPDEPLILAAARRPDFIGARRKPNLGLGPFLWIAVAAAAAALFLFLLPLRSPVERAETLVARAEQQQRPSEFRFSDAAPAPVRNNLRGAADPARGERLTLDADLNEASNLLDRTAGGTAAQLLRARIALASGKVPDGEAAAFEQAVKERGETPEALNDLAVAYASIASLDSGEASRTARLRRALEVLDRALQLAPRMPAALYNRALVLHRLGDKAAACDALARFLAAESDPGWESEARHRIPCPQ